MGDRPPLHPVYTTLIFVQRSSGRKQIRVFHDDNAHPTLLIPVSRRPREGVFGNRCIRKAFLSNAPPVDRRKTDRQDCVAGNRALLPCRHPPMIVSGITLSIPAFRRRLSSSVSIRRLISSIPQWKVNHEDETVAQMDVERDHRPQPRAVARIRHLPERGVKCHWGRLVDAGASSLCTVPEELNRDGGKPARPAKTIYTHAGRRFKQG